LYVDLYYAVTVLTVSNITYVIDADNVVVLDKFCVLRNTFVCDNIVLFAANSTECCEK